MDLWKTQFNGVEDEEVLNAVNILISTNKYPPTIADIKEQFQKYDYIPDELIWQLVLDAGSNANYNAQEEYDKLPEKIKKVVSVGELKEIALSSNENLVFIRKRILDDYHHYTNIQNDIQKLPNKQRKFLEERTDL